MPFVVFEGLDGSGKSSLMNRVETLLKTHSIKYVRTKEPGGTKLGNEIRELILKKADDVPSPRAELLLYEAVRAQHVDRLIRPALSEGYWVLCDRFSASSIAFQAGGRNISEDWVYRLNQFATDGLTPDLTILLDLSVSLAKKRRKQRNLEKGEQDDRIESEADQFHDRVRQSFLKQAQENPANWIVLDAGLSLDLLLQEVWTAFKQRNWL